MFEMTYEGQLRTKTTNENGVVLLTDGPTSVSGKGEQFSPTDLLALALGSCVLTLMGIAARNLGVDLGKTRAEIDKEMSKEAPRRITQISVRVYSTLTPSEEQRVKLEKAALTCPIHHSLHPDLRQLIEFYWGQ